MLKQLVIFDIIIINFSFSFFFSIKKKESKKEKNQSNLILIVILTSIFFILFFFLGRAIYCSTLSASGGNVLKMALEILIPDFLYVMSFSILLSYWTIIYSTAIGKGKNSKIIIITTIIANTIFFGIGVVIFILLALEIIQRGLFGTILSFTVATFSLLIAFSFAFLGIKLVLIFRKMPSQNRSKIIFQVFFFFLFFYFLF